MFFLVRKSGDKGSGTRGLAAALERLAPLTLALADGDRSRFFRAVGMGGFSALVAWELIERRRATHRVYQVGDIR